jgi:prealbumin domain-containing protein/beta-propeller repeat-containing protein
MNNINGWWAVSVYALALGGSIFANAVWAAIPGASCPADQERLQIAYRKLPLHFEVNQGQAEGTIKFLAQGWGYSLSLTPSEAVLNLHKPLSESPRQAGTSAVIPPPTAVVRMQLVGSSPAPEIAGEQPLPGKSHYLIGRDPGKWQTNIPHYARVRYRSVYPGIDLVYHGQQEQLEYDFVVAPGADPKQIRLDIQGAEKLYLDAAGNLVVRVAGGELIQQVPKVYQQVGDKRQAIPGRYVLANNQIGFEVGTYEATRPLVIDPVMCTAPGEGESSRGIAVDPEGQIYMTGIVGGQVFVTKLTADRQTVLYHCVFSGSGTQESTDIAVDPQGRAYVTGSTNSPDFPTTANALQGTLAGSTDAFIMRLAADGQPEYSTYLGGSGSDRANGIAVRKGRAYVTGETDSTNFPTEKPLQGSGGGGNDAFVAKLAQNGQRLVYSTYLGGGGSDIARGIAVRKGRAYVAGQTLSTNFPSANPLKRGVGNDAFVAKLAKDGQRLVYSTYLGGDGPDRANGIAVRKGQAYVTGGTGSTDFPMVKPLRRGGGPAQLSDSTDSLTANPLRVTRGGRLGLSGERDAFVTKLGKDGQDPVYSTYLGGSSDDRGQGIDVDPDGQIYVIGGTTSDNFPTEHPVQGTLGGGRDAFFAKLTEDGQELVYSTYLGGSGNERGRGLDVDPEGKVQSTVSTTNTDAAMNSINEGEDPVTDADAMPVGDSGSGNGTLIVTVEDVAPNIAVKKNANPIEVPASSGGSVTYSVVVTNNTPEDLMLTSLIDDKFGDLNGQGDCVVPQNLAANGTYPCSFPRSLPPGDPATPHINTVTATARNSAGIEDTATDDATVRFTSPATLKVIKQVVNDNGGSAKARDFTMYVKGNNPRPKDSFPGEESPATTVTLDAGDYEVTEGSVMGYTQISPSAECKGSIAAGETKTCTITNDDQPAQLTVTKNVVNDNGGSAAVGDFPLFVDGGSVISGAQNTFSAGAHTVSETNQPGYTATIGGDCAADGSITLNPGDVKTCTITNNDNPPPQQAQLTVTKNVVNDNGGSAAVGDFPLFVDGGSVTSGAQNTFATGPHTVSETNQPGYTATIGGDCAADGSITLNPGDVKTCTITNNDNPPEEPPPPG